MSTSELWDQKNIINDRLLYAQRIGHADMIKQLSQGLSRLDQLIQSRTNTDDSTGLI